MRKSTKTGAIAVALLPILFAAGCTGSDVLKPTTGNLNVTFELANVVPDGPFTDDPVGDPPNLIFPDIGFIKLKQITMRPTNPDADAALGLYPLGVLRRPLETLTYASETDGVALTLTSATYRLRAIVIEEVFLANRSDGMGGTGVNPAQIDPNNPRCTDFVRNFGSEFDLNLTDFGREVLISTDADVPAQLTVTLDTMAFIEAYTEAWNCGSCNCPALYDPNNPSTFSCRCDGSVTTFNTVAFRDRTPEFLTVQ